MAARGGWSHSRLLGPVSVPAGCIGSAFCLDPANHTQYCDALLSGSMLGETPSERINTHKKSRLNKASTKHWLKKISVSLSVARRDVPVEFCFEAKQSIWKIGAMIAPQSGEVTHQASSIPSNFLKLSSSHQTIDTDGKSIVYLFLNSEASAKKTGLA